MRVKTKDLNGLALDWAVMSIEFKRLQEKGEDIKPWVLERHSAGDPCGDPSISWFQGGPIIEREAYNLFRHNGGTEWCCACNVPRDGYTAIVTADGATPLIAAMRCYVLSRLGNTVDIPDNLVECIQDGSQNT